MINLRKTLIEVHATLEDLGVEHALIGGFALAAYGYHRATADVDFLADGSKREQIRAALLAKGFTLSYESAEVLQFIGLGFVDVLLANRPLSNEMLKRSIENSSIAMKVLKPEDIVGLKIQAYKNDPMREHQDKADIQNLLLVPEIDLAMVKKYADLFNEWAEIQKLMGLKKGAGK